MIYEVQFRGSKLPQLARAQVQMRLFLYLSENYHGHIHELNDHDDIFVSSLILFFLTFPSFILDSSLPDLDDEICKDFTPKL